MARSQMSFAGGVIHPLFVHRSADMESFAFGLRQSVNGIILETGAWTRRPGTYFSAQTKNNLPAYLVRWEYNKSDAYVLEFTDYKLRFFKDISLVETSGVVYEIDTPFTEAELPYIQTFQKKEVLWIVTGERGVYKLTRTDDDDWDLNDADITDGPFEDSNTNESLTVALDTTGIPGTAVVVTASASLFTANHVDGLLKIEGQYLNRSRSVSFVAAGEDSTLILLPIDAQWSWNVAVRWDVWDPTHQILASIQYSEDAITWSTLRELTLPTEAMDFLDTLKLYKSNLSGSNTLNKAVYLRAKVTSMSGVDDVDSTITIPACAHSGVVELTAYFSPTQMSGTIITEPTAATATWRWAMGAISGETGYPRALGFHDGRCILGGTATSPLTLNFGVAGEFENFTPGLNDDDAFGYSLDRPANRFNWIEGSWKDALIVGSEKGIIELVPYQAGGFTPTNIPSVRNTLILPTARIPPQMVEDIMLVVGGDGGKQLFQIFWSQERGGMIADDVTKFASHIAAGGFTGMAVQLGRRNLLWLPTDEGLAGCTYRPNLSAWHNHTFGDEVVSACTAPTASGERLWLCVRRGTKYFIEYMGLIDLDRETEDCYFMDCGVSWDGGDAVAVTSVTKANPAWVTLAQWPQDSAGTDMADGAYVRFTGYDDLSDQIFTVYNTNAVSRTFNLRDQTGAVTITGVAFSTFVSGTMEWVKNSITGMGHLSGDALLALCDGVKVDCTASATITFGTEVDNFYNTIHVGVEVTALIETLPPEFYLRSGSTLGKDKQLSGLTLSLYKSRGGRYAATGAREQDIPYHRTAAQTQKIPAPFTGKVNLGPSGGVFRDEMTVTITVDGPYPFTLRGMAPQIEVHG